MARKPTKPETVEDFLARGGQIEQLSNEAHGRPIHPTQHYIHAHLMTRIRAQKAARGGLTRAWRSGKSPD